MCMRPLKFAMGLPKRADWITFQILCATEYDKIREPSDGCKRSAERRCVVVLSGRTADGRSVVAALEGFRPSIKVLATDATARTCLDDVVGQSSANDDRSQDGAQVDVLSLNDFKGYRTGARRFARYAFASNMQFMIARKRLKDTGSPTYDAALPSSMQMLAELGLSPCQWVEMACSSQTRRSFGVLTCVGAWRDLRACSEPPASMAPFKVMAFDIECHSSHGEFPRARKGYDRLARELAALSNDQLGDTDRLHARLSEVLGIDDSAHRPDEPQLSHVYTKCKADRKAIARAANDLSAMFRPRSSARSDSDTKMMKLGCNSDQPRPIKRDQRILNALDRAGLPSVDGDPVIQIGTSSRVLGDPEDSDVNVIFVLGTCDDVANSRVVVCRTEKELLRAFFSYVREASPDFFTGYNVFGFDCAYLSERAQEVGLDLDAMPGAAHPALFDRDDFDGLLGFEWSLDRGKKLVTTRGTADKNETYFAMEGRVVFDLMSVVQKGHSLTSYRLDAVARHFTGEKKDDVSPEQIFASHTGSASDRAEVARYCIQDCRLVLHLIDKLNTVPNALGMADVCGVPVAWIFLRGQGCKILSLVARQCMRDGFAVPALGREDVTVTYEGATVLDPEVGAYIDTPVVVLDFSSLYPSSMISHNISHDTFVGHAFGGGTMPHGYAHVQETLKFDMSIRKYDRDKDKVVGNPLQEGETTASFVGKDTREGVVPRILKRLLGERKRVRALIKTESDAFRRSVLDGLQLAYKVTANSLYGQLGAPTSPVFMPELAAATTAVGRQMLLKLRDFAQTHAGARVIYGDTDSCFMVFESACANNRDPVGRIAASVEAGKACSEAFREHIPAPHDAEYEKTFSPFILMSKKRYAGNLYESADSAPRRASMGIVLRRRDNADIVKRVYGRVIDLVMDRDVAGATEYARTELVKLVKGQVDMSELTISKTLRAPSAYVDPDRIAHVVLAKRMNAREPGSAPNIGERMPYVHVVAKKGTLQGDRIEHPEYLKGAKIDYGHYLTNQLMKPLGQLFAVLIESVPGSRATRGSTAKAIDADVHRIVFSPAINSLPTAQGGLQNIASFFTPMDRQGPAKPVDTQTKACLAPAASSPA